MGVYYDDEGRIPLLQGRAQGRGGPHRSRRRPRLSADRRHRGVQQGCAEALLLGADSPLAAEGRVLTAQALGGTGALKIGADFLRQLLPQSKVLISDPSWENHRALFERAELPGRDLRLLRCATHGLNFEAMLAALQAAPEQTIVVLHACCHNPTGVDPTPQQWEQIAAVVKARNLVPFLDIAYQGFGEGLEQDAAVVRMFAELDLTMFISSSVLQVLLAVWRAGRGPDRGGRQQGRGRPRAQPAQARDPHQLLQPAHHGGTGGVHRS
ncbi:aminotransferase class I/II-fold pyridoxal phosphate-dependent enzyme [Bordetella pertussis]|uniref:aminotransferase class I/II-fold pyridoxal phosphate-dependent enzyme n=1 Tax=Bordetella pertussis TaxID=520 RepID=UPI0028E8BBC6|nr:aminotransferase class I/II-fold pyridoxal phosphate-dependent enzyme [Bordetella pertussis]WNR27568.1 aminotransferase class I/II-fold pyridoxal phosphate-dependent enzyme [Bordetella pertussis]